MTQLHWMACFYNLILMTLAAKLESYKLSKLLLLLKEKKNIFLAFLKTFYYLFFNGATLVP